jgi:branched-chain amino acid transport system substrate-binding protein
MRSRIVRLAVPAVVGAVALAGCGSNKSSNSGSSGNGGKTVTIGLIAPLTGALSALGAGMNNSVDLAVKQANANKTVKGWVIKYEPQDDQATPNVGAQVASKFASESNVGGVIGTLNSSVSQQVQPVLAQAKIVQISPANTNPPLSQGPNFAKGDKKRPYDSYFRTATTDSIQGPFAAQYIYTTAGKKTVATVDDKKAYGAGLVQQFSGEYTKLGGKIVDHESITPSQKDFSAVISRIKPKNPQAVYYGGEYPEASLLSKQMKAAGLNVPLMGGDGIQDPTYIKVAGTAATGDLATSVGAPTDQLATAKSFIADYKAAGYKDGYSTYGALSYDSANVLIAALAKALNGKDKIDDSVKQAIITDVQNTKMDGASGVLSFDKFGDTTNKVITVYKVTGGKWTPVKTGSFTG